MKTMRDHNRFVNQMIALGGCLRFFLDRCGVECGDGRKCREGIEIAFRWTERLRAMTRWRRWLFDLAVRILVR